MRHLAGSRWRSLARRAISTLVIADQKRRGPLGGSTIEAIEPYPRAFLEDPALGIALHETKVQAMPLAFFESLRAGDVLFVDSSHVAEAGAALTGAEVARFGGGSLWFAVQ